MINKTSPDTLAAPVLTPPGHTGSQHPGESGNYRWLWLALAAVLVIGLAVIFALPSLIDAPRPENAPANAPANAPVAARVESRDTANESMQAWLQLRARLELEHASQWGEPNWSQSEQAADSGARMLAQRQFGEAARYYEQALQGLVQLDNERYTRLVTALATAEQALAENKLEKAIEQFEQVLVMQPENEDARYGLTRAQTRPAVLDSMAAGQRYEASGHLLDAQGAYQEAALLEPEYEPAGEAFNRVSEALQSGAFQVAMTRTLRELDNHQRGYKGALNRAEKALAEASAIRPTDTAVVDARQRLSAARQQTQLNTLRRQADNSVKNENWVAANNLYKRVLAIDSTAGFALAGLEKAEARLELNRQFDHYLKNPERLYTAEPLANAEQLLATAGSAPANEPKLAKKIATLQQRVTDAGTPVTVTLQSDGETDISIYHVGQLGAFTYLQLELLPGTYTVVGTRYGFRDIRKQLSVQPGNEATDLFIRCEEVI